MRGRESANATIVTGTRKLPSSTTLGRRIVSSVTPVMTAATIQIAAPASSRSRHRLLEVIAGTPAEPSATGRSYG